MNQKSITAIWLSFMIFLLHCRPDRLKHVQPHPLPAIQENLLKSFKRTDGGATKVSDSDLLKMPYQTTGRFYTTLGPFNDSCTGSLLVGSNGKKYLLTAAHCAFDLDAKFWLQDQLLCMGATKTHGPSCSSRYNLPRVSLMKYAQRSRSVASYDTKIQGSSFVLYDQAIMALDREPIEPALTPSFVSGVSVAASGAQIQSLGYPLGGDFKEGFMYQYSTSNIAQWPGIMMMMGNNMDGGASGGPWIYQNASGGYVLTGMNSAGAQTPAPQVASAIFGKNQKGLYDCATSAGLCQPYKPGDGQMVSAKIPIKDLNNIAIDKQATYINEGVISEMHFRRLASACNGKPISASAMELNFFKLSPTGDLIQRLCFDLGIAISLNSFSQTIMRDSALPKILLTAHTRADGQIELNTFSFPSDGLSVARLYTDTTSGSGGTTNNVVVRQVLNNNFAVFKQSNGNMFIEIWQIDYVTGRIAKTGSAKSGPGMSAFSAENLAAKLGQTDQIIVAASISGRISLITYKIDFSLNITQNFRLDTGLTLSPYEASRANILQMDNGIIVIGNSDANQNANISSFGYNGTNLYANNQSIFLTANAGDVALADMGNDILLAVTSGDGLPAALVSSVRVNDVGALALLSNYNNMHSNTSSAVPIYYGINPQLSTALMGFFGTSSSGFYLNTLNVTGTTDMRYVTLAE